MKRILSFMMALVLVFLMSVNVIAAENPDANTELVGSVTITNPTAGETYTIYKIFDAHVKQANDTNKKGVSYSIQQDNQFFADMFKANDNYSNDVFVYNADAGNGRNIECIKSTEKRRKRKSICRHSEHAYADIGCNADSI